MSDAALEICKLDPAPAPEISIDEARARVREFAGVDPAITRIELWRPGEEKEKSHIRWLVGIRAAHPADLETGGLTLSGAVEQLRVAAADSPGWRRER